MKTATTPTVGEVVTCYMFRAIIVALSVALVAVVSVGVYVFASIAYFIAVEHGVINAIAKSLSL